MTISTSEPFELVTMDFLLISSAPSGYQYALVFNNQFNKFALVVPTKDQTAVNTTSSYEGISINPMAARSRSKFGLICVIFIHHDAPAYIAVEPAITK